MKISKIYKFAIFLFISILTLHGTYLVIHNPGLVVPKMNGLVFARLLACSISFMIGVILIPKDVKWGLGSKILIFYVLAAGISSLNSPYPETVIGYFILLLGASFLMIGLVYHAQNLVQLETIEKIWFLTLTILVLKDSIISILFSGLQTVEDVSRLGMNVTSATTLSLYAGLIFWISFRQKWLKYSVVLWLLRVFLLYVLFAARSRVSIAAFLFAGLFFILFKTRNYRMRWIIVFTVTSMILFYFLSLSFEHEWAKAIIAYMKRGQDTTDLFTFTGRSLVWQHVLKQSLESPIIGHGYAISRLTIGEVPINGATPAHAHNEFLEIFFNTGLLGLIPFLVMLMYNIKWIIHYSRLSRIYSNDFVLHAVCTNVMLLISSLFEVRLGGKIDPSTLLFFLYLLTLDREKYFSAGGSIVDPNFKTVV